MSFFFELIGATIGIFLLTRFIFWLFKLHKPLLWQEIVAVGLAWIAASGVYAHDQEAMLSYGIILYGVASIVVIAVDGWSIAKRGRRA